jgi:hypothetical protein
VSVAEAYFGLSLILTVTYHLSPIHPLAALLLFGHSVRDGLMSRDAFAGLLDQCLGGLGIA